VNKHLLPRFGDWQLSNITRQEIQAYVAHLTQTGYAPKTVDHIHDVLSAILRTAMKWGHIKENPARGVDLPALRCIRPKWALTTSQAAALLADLPVLPRTMVGLAILSGVLRQYSDGGANHHADVPDDRPNEDVSASRQR